MSIDTDTIDLDYDSRSGDYTAEFHGLTVKAVREDGAENPWENWDGQVPMVYASWDRNSYGGGSKPAVHDSGYDILNPFALMSDGFIIRYQRAICEALGTDHEIAAKDIQNNIDYERRTYKRSTYSRVEAWRDLFREVLSEFSSSVRLLEAVDRVYDLTKVQHYLGTTRGYSQGDELQVLCVATPKWLEAQGITKPYGEEQFKGDVDLLGAWAWGDVYGYVIEDENGDHLDSCWGFYGTDFEKSGLQDEALSAARHEAKKRYDAQAEEAQADRPDLYEIA